MLDVFDTCVEHFTFTFTLRLRLSVQSVAAKTTILFKLSKNNRTCVVCVTDLCV